MHIGLHEVDYARTQGYMWDAATQRVYRVMYTALHEVTHN